MPLNIPAEVASEHHDVGGHKSCIPLSQDSELVSSHTLQHQSHTIK